MLKLYRIFMIYLKSEEEVYYIKKAGEIIAEVFKRIKECIREGMKTKELDILAYNLVTKLGGYPAFLGYKGYPASICVSINEEVIHGIPSDRIIKEGDIVEIDLGVYYQGYYNDAAITLPIGNISQEAKRLLITTKNALYIGIEKAKAGNRLGDISYAIQSYVEKRGYSVVRKFAGHGVGIDLHEDPDVPNYGKPGKGVLLKKGMVLCIEPMVNVGSYEVEITNNNWTVVTKDKSLSCHFEHAVYITDGNPQILTPWDI
jgi:methionyl aminopeptidase